MDRAITADPVVDDSYRKAKVDHYLDRVEELVGMARYSAARSMLNKALALEPHNRGVLTLQQHIDVALRLLATPSLHKSNGQRDTARRGKLVLVVDQDERVLMSLVESLRKYGFGAIGAASFGEAVEALAHHVPSLIISEVNFENGPVGFDLYFWVRNNSGLSWVPFLYLATRVTREMFIAGKRLGVDEFIVKPLDEEVVMASVLSCLGKRKQRVP